MNDEIETYENDINQILVDERMPTELEENNNVIEKVTITKKTKAEKREEKFVVYKEKRQLTRKIKRQKQKEIKNNKPDGVLSRKAVAKIGVKMADSSCKVRVVLDCSFEDLMVPKDVAKLQNQICNSYSINRRSQTPLQFYITSLGGILQEKFENTGNPKGEYKSWDLYFQNDRYDDIFKKEEIVYLCAESDNVLHEFQSENVYVIGGLVDHNHHKGYCFNKAQELGLKTARLPLSEYVTLKSRTVLSVVHVLELILRRCEGHDWVDCLQQAIPKRKMEIGASKSDNKEDSGSSS